jgi:hypothetical protein
MTGAAEAERLAEAAYAAMYDAPPWTAKVWYEDARRHFRQAIDIAAAGENSIEANRLARRLEHVETIYNHQFRNVGR